MNGESHEETLAALDEAVRGRNGLQAIVLDLRAEVSELTKFRNIIIGVQIAVGFLSPFVFDYFRQKPAPPAPAAQHAPAHP